MIVPAYVDRKDIVDVNIVAVGGNRIGVYDKALPVKISAGMNGVNYRFFTKHTCVDYAVFVSLYFCVGTYCSMPQRSSIFLFKVMRL